MKLRTKNTVSFVAKQILNILTSSMSDRACIFTEVKIHTTSEKPIEFVCQSHYTMTATSMQHFSQQPE